MELPRFDDLTAAARADRDRSSGRAAWRDRPSESFAHLLRAKREDPPADEAARAAPLPADEATCADPPVADEATCADPPPTDEASCAAPPPADEATCTAPPPADEATCAALPPADEATCAALPPADDTTHGAPPPADEATRAAPRPADEATRAASQPGTDAARQQGSAAESTQAVPESQVAACDTPPTDLTVTTSPEATGADAAEENSTVDDTTADERKEETADAVTFLTAQASGAAAHAASPLPAAPPAKATLDAADPVGPAVTDSTVRPTDPDAAPPAPALPAEATSDTGPVEPEPARDVTATTATGPAPRAPEAAQVSATQPQDPTLAASLAPPAAPEPGVTDQTAARTKRPRPVDRPRPSGTELPRDSHAPTERPGSNRAPAAGPASLPVLQQLADAASGSEAREGSESPVDTAAPRAQEEGARAAGSAARETNATQPRPAALSKSDTQLSHMDQLRLVQRVARAVQAAPTRGGTLRLRLKPPELGSLQLEVRLERGGLTARLEAETQAARSVLLDNLPQLRDRLEEQGMRLLKFTVDVAQQDAGEGQQQSDTMRSHQRSRDPGAGQHKLGNTPEEAGAERQPVQVIGQQNLNVVI